MNNKEILDNAMQNQLKLFAEKLTKFVKYRDIPEELIKEAVEKGIVIVSGESDDLMEFDGAIFDEVGCYEGGTVLLTQDGIIEEDCMSHCKTCKWRQRAIENCKSITALWCKSEWTWSYKTDIPHEKFYILDEEEKYCEGLVFYKDSLRRDYGEKNN